MSREIMQQALDALLHMCNTTKAQNDYNAKIFDKALVALEAALAQPEQDHGFDRTASHMAGDYVDTAEQEPVAWLYNGHLHECDPSEWAITEVRQLYTAPPKRELAKPEQEFKYTPYGLRSDENGKLSIGEISQREWVGLTVGEVIDIQNCNRGFWTNAAKIEQLLKDKNT